LGRRARHARLFRSRITSNRIWIARVGSGGHHYHIDTSCQRLQLCHIGCRRLQGWVHLGRRARHARLFRSRITSNRIWSVNDNQSGEALQEVNGAYSEWCVLTKAPRLIFIAICHHNGLGGQPWLCWFPGFSTPRLRMFERLAMFEQLASYIHCIITIKITTGIAISCPIG